MRAVKDVLDNLRPLRQVAKDYKIAKSSLSRYVSAEKERRKLGSVECIIIGYRKNRYQRGWLGSVFGIMGGPYESDQAWS